jgi:hypothetical protein
MTPITDSGGEGISAGRGYRRVASNDGYAEARL